MRLTEGWVIMKNFKSFAAGLAVYGIIAAMAFAVALVDSFPNILT